MSKFTKGCFDTVINKRKMLGYCKLHKCGMTRKQIKAKKCLSKQCRHFVKYNDHPYWKEKERIKQLKKLKKENNMRIKKDEKYYEGLPSANELLKDIESNKKLLKQIDEFISNPATPKILVEDCKRKRNKVVRRIQDYNIWIDMMVKGYLLGVKSTKYNENYDKLYKALFGEGE